MRLDHRAPPLALHDAHIADAAGKHRCEVQLRGSPPVIRETKAVLKPGTKN